MLLEGVRYEGYCFSYDRQVVLLQKGLSAHKYGDAGLSELDMILAPWWKLPPIGKSHRRYKEQVVSRK